MENTNRIPNEIKTLIVKYLSEDISAEETLLLTGWINASEENLFVLKEITMIWKASSLQENLDFDAQKAWNEVSGKLKKRETKVGLKLISTSILKYAALILITFLAGSGLTYFLTLQEGNYSGKLIEVTAPLGSRSTITLNDGSSVSLNAGSSIRYSPSFGKKDRNIELQGEAWFEVAHNKALAFTVHSDNVKIIVFGTSFIVSAYPEEQHIQTFLEQGSVEMEIGATGNKTKLLPGDIAIYNKESHKVIVEKNKDPNIVSWRFGEISFYNEPLEQIARKLERRFGVTISFESKELAQMRLTAEFEKEEFDQIIKYLEEIAGLEINKQQNVYHISSKH